MTFSESYKMPIAVAVSTTDAAYREVALWARNANVNANTGAVTLIDATLPSRNRKVAKLEAIASYAVKAGFSHILFLDADIVMPSVAFRELDASFLDERVGAACQASGSEPTSSGLAATAESAVVNGSQQALPLLLRLNPRLLAGAVLALRLDVLRDLGGWAQFGHLLGEDMALATEFEKSAWQVVSIPTTAMAARSCTDVKSLWERMVRWLGVIREQRPLILLAYPLMFFYAIPLCLFWAKLYDAGAPLWLALAGGGVTIYSRGMVGREARLATIGSARGYEIARDAFLSDLFLMAVWIRILWAPAKSWSGNRV